MTNSRRTFLKNAGKTTAIAAVSSVVVAFPAQAILRNQLKALIHDLRNPDDDSLITFGSFEDNLDTANRLAEIIGDEIIPFERYVWHPSDALGAV